MTPSTPSLLRYHAPRVLLGAFFLFTSCEGQADEKSPSTPPSPEQTLTTTQHSPSDSPTTPTSSFPKDIRFMSYNLKNYLSMEVYRKGGIKEKRPKDPAEIEAIIDIITREKPHILGICEIGTPEDLNNLQQRLKQNGLHLPHRVHTGGFDPVRHLAILSAYPILENNSQKNLPFQIGEFQRLMGRGILSVLIDLPIGPTHFVGLHLKSKRPLKYLDQASIRLQEARLAKNHCNTILQADPSAQLILYGDINDTPRTPTLSILRGRSHSKHHLKDIFVKDSRGQLWTYYWAYQQQYTRFDYVFTSRSATPLVNLKKSYLSDLEHWNQASDHRPIIITLQKQKK